MTLMMVIDIKRNAQLLATCIHFTYTAGHVMLAWTTLLAF